MGKNRKTKRPEKKFQVNKKRSSQEVNNSEKQQNEEEKVSTTIEENMFIEILKIMSEPAITNQRRSSDLFQSLLCKLMMSQSCNTKIFNYLNNILDMVINAIPITSIQKLDTYINCCITEFTKQETSNEDILDSFNQFKLQIKEIKERKNSFQYQLPFIDEFEHTCQLNSDLCYAPVPKKYANCQHIEYLPCHIDINQLECKILIHHTLKCGHEISLRCHKLAEKEPKCQFITHKFKDCGHVIKVPCSTDITKLKCSNNCDCRLICGHSCPEKCHRNDKEKHRKIQCEKDCQRVICERGHKCPLKCWEKCPGKCDEIVDKELECGHTLKASCSIPIDELTCDQPCDVILDCGHQCQNDCWDECTDECTASVILERSCGHEVVISCHERNAPSVIDPDNCNESCNATLPCLHKCRGTCGQCRQGRLHVVCQVVCKKPLVCGHSCNHPCHLICPTCSQPCLTKCKHSRCWDLCYEDCGDCNEKCEWKCQHFECQKLCHEMCDRPRCNEPCKKKLECNHQCIGLCGEECPSLCRICNNKELTEFILSGVEDDKNARFIQLVDCGHCIEVSGMDNWMDTETEEVKMKECPRCKTTVWTSNRYGNVIRKQFKEITIVKDKIYYGDMKELWDKAKHLATTIRSFPDVGINFETEIDDFLFTLDCCVLRCTGCTHLNLIENQFNVLLSITKLKTKFKKLIKGKTAEDYFSTKVQFLVIRLLEDEEVVNEMRIADIYKELTRIKFQTMVREERCQQRKYRNYYLRAKEILASNSKLTDTEETEVQENVHEIFRRVPNYGLEITEAERVMIVEAVGLKPGHWYKCPNGHIYLITECGGADVRGFCNECGAPIGGENHALDAGNAHAGEMDGSSHPAWSNETGLGNYLHLNG